MKDIKTMRQTSPILSIANLERQLCQKMVHKSITALLNMSLVEKYNSKWQVLMALCRKF